MPGEGRSEARSVVSSSLARGGGLVAPALMLANLAGYLLAVGASRALDPAAYGELGALLGVLLVGSVPALAVQAVVARAVVKSAPEGPSRRHERDLLRRSLLLGLLVGAGVAAVSPGVAAFLHIGVAGPLWLAAGLVPLALVSAVLGLLQGAERFGGLALVICLQGAAKLAGLVPLLLGAGPSSVLAALAVGTAVTAAGGLVVLRPPVGAPGQGGLLGPRTVVAAGAGLLALLVLANLDLLLARNGLPRRASGDYAVGNVLAKAAFWLPQAVAVVVFPRLADPVEGGRVLRRAVALVGGVTLLAVAGAALLARPALELAFGVEYGALAGEAPLFVLQGGALAVVQLLVYRAIAVHDPRVPRLVVVATVVEASLLATVVPATVLAFVTTAAVVAVALAAVGLLLSGRVATGPSAPAPGVQQTGP